MSAPLPSLVLYAILWAVMTRPCLSASVVEGDRFTVSRTGVVTSYETLKSARSKTDCLQACFRLSNFLSVAYDRQSTNCYMNPVVDIGQANSSAAVKVYEKTSNSSSNKETTSYTSSNGETTSYTSSNGETTVAGSVCSQTDVTIPNGYVHQWNQSSEALEGLVVCDANYTFSNNSVGTARCTDGAWTVNGECKQKYFYTGNYQTGMLFDFPQLPPFQIGGLCLQARPMNDVSFALWFEAANGVLVMKMEGIFDYYGHLATVFKAIQNNVIMQRDEVTDYEYFNDYRDNLDLSNYDHYHFPFVAGQDFVLSINLTTEGNFNIYVDNDLYWVFTPVLDVTTITKFVIDSNLGIFYLNLACNVSSL